MVLLHLFLRIAYMDDIHVPVLEVIVMCHSEEKLYFAFRGTHEWNRLPERHWFLEKAENMVIDPSKLWSFIVIYGYGMVCNFFCTHIFFLFLIWCINILFVFCIFNLPKGATDEN